MVLYFEVQWYSTLSHYLQIHADSTAPWSHLDYDLVGLSMYPAWDNGKTLQNIAKLPTLAAALPGKRIYIAETSYPAAGDMQPLGAFPATPNG
jgi:arabinogalactan endo-1,4-beta-galactosidase